MDAISIILFVLLGIDAILLILLVLFQHDQGDGMAGLFGGSSSNQVGNRQGNVLTKSTTILGVVFFVLCVGIGITFKLTKESTKVAAADTTKVEKINLDKPINFELSPSPVVSTEPSTSPLPSGSPVVSAPASSQSPAPSLVPSPSPTKKP